MASQVERSVERELREACAELDQRLRAGEPCRAEDLLAKHPEIGAEPELALELIYTEFATRDELGQRPDAADLFERFPQWRERIKRLVEVHEAVGPEQAGEIGPAIGDTPFALRSTFVPGERGARPDSARLARIGQYELLEELGTGGMGLVYRARQRGLGRLVAVKLVRYGAQATPEERARFRAEAEAAARLHHPHIVQIYEIGEHAGCPYLSFEFVDGGSLEQRLRDTPEPVPVAARLIETLARAIHYAHQRGVVHRDLKPANVLLALSHRDEAIRLSGDGDAGFEPKIADFGLAKLLDLESTRHEPAAPRHDLTQTGCIVGTPSYMAPEQAAGRTRDIGPASDVYALGAILYRMLTGRPPFQGESVLDTLQQIRSHEPVPPGRLRPKLPRDLETICLKCLQKEPSKRFATAEELASDLSRFLAGEPIVARPAAWWERVGRWAQRRPAVAALMAAVLTVAAAGFAGVTWQWSVARDQWLRAEGGRVAVVQALHEAKEARNAEAAERDRVERLLYTHEVALAHFEYLNNNPERSLQLLDGCRTDLRHWEWRYLKRLCQQEQFSLTGHSLPVYDLAYSPDGSRLATCSARWGHDEPGEIIVWDTTTGQRLFTLRGHPSSIRSIAFSPDGSRLASAGDVFFGKEPGGVKLWDLATGKEVVSVPDTGDVASVAFSPDGRILALGGAGGLFRFCDSVTGVELRRLTGHSSTVCEIAFNSDGDRVATAGSGDHTVIIWDVATGDAISVLHMGNRDGDVRSIAYRPDGRMLACASYFGTVRIWDVATDQFDGNPKHQWHSGGPSAHVVFSPDGVYLAASNSEGVAIVNPATGAVRRKIHAHRRGRMVAAFRPDGRHIATGGFDGIVKIWDLASLPASQTWRLKSGAASHLSSMAMSQDGKRLVAASALNRSSPGRGVEDTALVIWDVAKQTGRTFKEHSGWLNSVAMSADGRRAVTASDDKTAKLWDAGTGTILCTFHGHTDAVTDVAFNPLEDHVVSASSDRTIRVWDATSGQQRHGFQAHEGAVLHLAYDPKGRLLASAGADQSVKLWDATRWNERVHLRLDTNAVDLAFSPDGNLLACCGNDRFIRVWNVAGLLSPQPTTQPLFKLEGHSDWVSSISFSPDGKRLVSISPDQTIRLWSLDTGDEAITLQPNRTIRYNSRVLFSPDGRRILLSSGREVEVWDSESGVAAPGLAEARDRAILLLERGDEPAYRALCAQMMEQFYPADAPRTANTIAWLCALAADAVPELGNVVRLAEQAVAAAATPSQRQNYLNTLGAALYRAGRYDDAIARLHESISAGEADDAPHDWIFLAMSHARLGQTEQAMAWRDKTAEWMKTQESPSSDTPRARWQLRLEIRLLLRQAENLVPAPD